MNAQSENAASSRCAEWLASRRDAMVDFACDLIRFASENPPGACYLECISRIIRELDALGMPHSLKGGGWIVESSYGPAGRPLYLSGHYDVVPAQSAAQFTPVIRDGRLFGRGSSDMKGGIATMLYAVAALSATHAALDGPVILRCVPDEETGGARGTAILATIGDIDADAVGMITAEPTSGVVWNASRGAISWRVTATGREAHVGLHYLGINAFDAIMELVAELQALRSSVVVRKTQSVVSDERARSSVLLIGGEMESGSNFNVVPARCTITLDRRINPEERLDEERDRLMACVERARDRGATLEVEVIQEGAASRTDEDAPVSRALADAITQVTGTAPSFELCPGLLETRFYSAAGVPALAYGPGDLGVSHGPEEHIELSRMYDAASVYAFTALSLLGVTQREASVAPDGLTIRGST